MTDVSFKVIRSTAQSNKGRLKIISSLGKISTVKINLEDRWDKYAPNGNNPIVTDFFAAIIAKPGRTVSETLYDVMTARGLNFDDRKTQIAYRTEINFILANTAEGFIAVRNNLVAVSPLGPKPMWFKNLTITEQATIPQRGAPDQEEEVGYDASVPALIGPSYDGIRNGYVGVSGLGARWISPSRVARIRNTDETLKVVAAEDTERRQQILHLDVLLIEQKAKTAEAESRFEALMSKNEESILHSDKSQMLIQNLLESKEPIVLRERDAGIEALQQQMVAMAKASAERDAALKDFMATFQAPPAAPAKAKRARAPRKARVATPPQD